MQILMNENSINSITNRGRYPDAVVKNLQLWVKKPGNMYWILRFKIDGDRKDMSLGACPKISLDDARELAILTNKQINQVRVFELLKERIKATFSQDEDIEITIRDVAAKWTEQPSNKRTHLIRSNISKLVEYGLVETGLREQNQDRIWITEKGLNQ